MKSFKNYLIESIIDDGDGMGGPNDTSLRNRVPPGSIPPPKGPRPTPMYLVPTGEQDGTQYPTIPGDFPKPPNTFGQPQIDYTDLDRFLRELEELFLDEDMFGYDQEKAAKRLLALLRGTPYNEMASERRIQMHILIAQARLDILKKYPHMTDQQRQTIEQLLKALYYRWVKEMKDRHPEMIPRNFD